MVFHKSTGGERTSPRRAYLRRLRQGRVAKTPGVVILNGTGYGQACAVGAVTFAERRLGQVDGDTRKEALEPYPTARRGQRIPRIRVSPNVCTTIEDEVRFTAALESIPRA